MFALFIGRDRASAASVTFIFQLLGPIKIVTARPHARHYSQPSYRSRTTNNHISAGKGRWWSVSVVDIGWDPGEEFSAAIGDRPPIGSRKLSVWPVPLAVLIRGSSPVGRTNRKEIGRPNLLAWRSSPASIRPRISNDGFHRRSPRPSPESRC